MWPTGQGHPSPHLGLLASPLGQQKELSLSRGCAGPRVPRPQPGLCCFVPWKNAMRASLQAGMGLQGSRGPGRPLALAVPCPYTASMSIHGSAQTHTHAHTRGSAAISHGAERLWTHPLLLRPNRKKKSRAVPQAACCSKSWARGHVGTCR